MKYNNVETFLRDKYTDQKAERYALASVYFEKAVYEKSQKNFMAMMKYMFKSVLTSKEYAIKIWRYIWQMI